MRNLAIKEGLDPDKDLRPFGNSTFGLLSFINDYQKLSNYTIDHPNQTHLMVQFTSGYLYRDKMPENPGYVVWYNNSRNAKYSNDAKSFLRAIDEQIASEKLGRNVSFNASRSDFPSPVSRFSQFDVVSANGGVYFYLVPMIVFFVLLSGIVQVVFCWFVVFCASCHLIHSPIGRRRNSIFAQECGRWAFRRPFTG